MSCGIKLRSQNCNEASQIVFKNTCCRGLDVFWLDYKGNRVKYYNLQPGQSGFVSTFVTHPWEFRDALTGDVLESVADGQRSRVYMPKVWSGGNPERVDIVLPVYTLRERCLQIVRQLISKDDIPALEIPKTLSDDLLKIPKEQYRFKVYVPP